MVRKMPNAKTPAIARCPANVPESHRDRACMRVTPESIDDHARCNLVWKFSSDHRRMMAVTRSCTMLCGSLHPRGQHGNSPMVSQRVKDQYVHIRRYGVCGRCFTHATNDARSHLRSTSLRPGHATFLSAASARFHPHREAAPDAGASGCSSPCDAAHATPRWGDSVRRTRPRSRVRYGQASSNPRHSHGHMPRASVRVPVCESVRQQAQSSCPPRIRRCVRSLYPHARYLATCVILLSILSNLRKNH